MYNTQNRDNTEETSLTQKVGKITDKDIKPNINLVEDTKNTKEDSLNVNEGNGNTVVKVLKSEKALKRELSEGEASSDFETISSVDTINELKDFLEFNEDFVVVKNKTDDEEEKRKNTHRYIRDSTESTNEPNKSEYFLNKSNKHIDCRGLQQTWEHTRWESRSRSKSGDRRNRSKRDKPRIKVKDDLIQCRPSISQDQTKQNSDQKFNRSRSSEGRRNQSFKDSGKDRKRELKFNKVDSLEIKRMDCRENEVKFSTIAHKFRLDAEDVGLSSSDPPIGKRRKKRSREDGFSLTQSPEWKRRNEVFERNEKGLIKSSKKKRKKSSRNEKRMKDLRQKELEVEKKLKEAQLSKGNEFKDVVKDQLNPPEIGRVPFLESVPFARNLPLPTLPSLPSVNPVALLNSCPPIPTLSLDNLPLVPGPKGLPIHITATGDLIPYDMEGRRIPVGPNGHYLPLDPSGRLFPHIVSPENTAVPIHMTDDGVLRLPNSERLPFGPPHQLPINIDGSLILIGPDSKPLSVPCPALPRHPPPGVLPDPNFEGGRSVRHPQELQNQIHIRPESSQDRLNLFEPTQDVSLLINKGNFVKKYQRHTTERRNDVVKCIEIQQNLGVNSPKSGVNTSNPSKLVSKKILQDRDSESGSDMVDSGDSSSLHTSKPSTKARPVLPDSTVDALNSDDENLLKFVCGVLNKQDETVRPEPKPQDPITKKIKLAIKSLSDKDFKPPVAGRFIIPKISISPIERSPNESPLRRNRIMLPFVVPASEKFFKVEETPTEIPEVKYKFLPQKTKNEGKILGRGKLGRAPEKSQKTITFDFAMQCDFTSEIIRSLNLKVTDLKNEIVKLTNINANLSDVCKQVQSNNERISFELHKALNEIVEKNNEIVMLKRGGEEKGKVEC